VQRAYWILALLSPSIDGRKEKQWNEYREATGSNSHINPLDIVFLY